MTVNINDRAMSPDEYDGFVNRLTDRIEANSGWIPRCPNCFIRGFMRKGHADRKYAVKMEPRSSTVSRNAHYAGAAHEDVVFKCPSCQTHLNIGHKVPESVVEDYEEHLDGDHHFDAGNDIDDQERAEERLRTLGYL